MRTLEVKFGYNGERHRSFRESVKELQQTDFEDFPLDYMRTWVPNTTSATRARTGVGLLSLPHRLCQP